MKKVIKNVAIVISLILSFALASCSYKVESTMNISVNGKNVIDAKSGFDTDNPDLITLDVNTTEFRKVNMGKLDGKPISWYVVFEDDDYNVLLSEKVLDSMPYHKEDVKIEWTQSSLFDYLNSDFVNECFDANERAKLAFINDEDEAIVTIPSLNNLLDMYGRLVYMPDEYYGVKDLFDANPKIVASPTERAINNDIDVFDNAVFAEIMKKDVDSRYDFANGKVSYWVIDTMEDENDAFYASATGYIGYREPNSEYIGYRPMIRIKRD